MTKKVLHIFLQVILALGICLGLTGGLTGPVEAVTPCTWTGAINHDWMTTGNWSCGVVPTAAHDVTIANVTNDPLITTRIERQVNSLLIEAGGVLEATEGGFLNLLVQTMTGDGVTNYGTIKTTSSRDDTTIRFITGRTFNNYGTIDIGVGIFSATAYKGGTQNGILSGQYGSIGLHGDSGASMTFGPTSLITVKHIYFDYIPTVNIYGRINQTWPGSEIDVDWSFVTYYFTLPYSLGVVEVSDYYLPGWFKMTSAGSHIGSVTVPLMVMLNGTGSISENLDNYGTVSPGESAGMISVGGTYTQFVTDDPGELEMELGGLDAGTTYDQLLVTGLATLDGTLKVSLIDPFMPSLGQVFTIMTYGSHTGEFDTVDYPPLDPGMDLEITYGDTALILTVVEAPYLHYLPLIIR